MNFSIFVVALVVIAASAHSPDDAAAPVAPPASITRLHADNGFTDAEDTSIAVGVAPAPAAEACVPNPGKDHQAICDGVQQWINDHNELMQDKNCDDVSALTCAKSLLLPNDACQLNFKTPAHHLALLETNKKVGGRLGKKLAAKAVTLRMSEFLPRIETASACDVPQINYCKPEVPCLSCAPKADAPSGAVQGPCNCPPPLADGSTAPCPCAAKAVATPCDCANRASSDTPCPCHEEDAILHSTLPAAVLPHVRCDQLFEKMKCDVRVNDTEDPCQWYEKNEANIPPILHSYCGSPLVLQEEDDEPLLVSHCTEITTCGPCDLQNQCEWNHLDLVCQQKAQDVRIVDKLPAKPAASAPATASAPASAPVIDIAPVKPAAPEAL